MTGMTGARRISEAATAASVAARTGDMAGALDVMFRALQIHTQAASGGLRDRLVPLDQVHLIPRADPLIDGVLDRNTIALILGKFGTYKSFVSVAWACCVATGTAWEGHAVRAPGPVLYVAADGAYSLMGRIAAWEHVTGVKVSDLVILDGRVLLTDPGQMRELRDICEEMRPALVVVDTLHRCAGGIDENDNGDAGAALKPLFDLRDMGATVLINHHTGHSGQHARGASAWEDAADTIWLIDLVGEDRSAENQRTMKHRKSKSSEVHEDIPIVLAAVPEVLDDLGEPEAYVTVGVVESPDTPLSGSQVVAGLIRRLDDLGVPRGAGRGACVAALKAAGVSVPQNSVMAEVVRTRKATEGNAGGHRS